MNRIIMLPLLIPLVTAVAMLLLRIRVQLHRVLNVVSAALSGVVALAIFSATMSSGVLSLQVGGWEAPFGISLVADRLSAVMVVMSALIGLCTALYSIGTIDEDREHYFYHPLLQLLLMGVNGAFLTGDIFNLYVWFEVMLISSFVLLVLGGLPQQLEGAIKYVTLNLLSSAIFLAAVGILYGMAGTLNMADLAVRIPLLEHRELLTVVAVLFMITFGVKAAVFPLFFWLPASYHTPPVAVSAVFAGLLTKVGVYAIMRFFTTVFVCDDAAFIYDVLLWSSGFTMVVGVLGAVAQYDMRKLLSFHIISQIGYMIFAVALQSPLAVAGGLFYMVHNIVAKTNLFYVSGLVKRLAGSYCLRDIGGLYRLYPLFGLLFLVPALGLAGIPPLSGFWAKLMVIRAGIEAGAWGLTAVALSVSMLTLFSMIKIWNEAFWKDDPRGEQSADRTEYHAIGRLKQGMIIAPIVVLGLVTVVFGFWFEPFFEMMMLVAEELLEPARYIRSVTGGVL
ncbi:Na+/H+ antiporter subunit D [Prosthecochloris sp. N3]|uniref:Na+/H+ antiporter subunit D n=1 Tax=Prosthecochloris ethylica TaxID=2743976 RepID=A0ABR9XSU5_9CHLB|nr:Na+/H+ antiporter subunit D [Prosthecochloris ethylica]MBF0585955.1 Na+/H+ antiporter subunit D [Prosthecochloris ethylica]MBF0637040.1 Na+/H+ antiporter subunit D [Prosthecochloris ethylica]NUK47277.1 Na+/H+ antiporter subunit D [Prosthecochloris ethylica]